MARPPLELYSSVPHVPPTPFARQARELYRSLEGKPHFRTLAEFMSSGPVRSEMPLKECRGPQGVY